MSKKQTAVEWLIENAKGFHNAESSKAMQEKALKMEREQIEDAFDYGTSDYHENSGTDYYEKLKNGYYDRKN